MKGGWNKRSVVWPDRGRPRIISETHGFSALIKLFRALSLSVHLLLSVARKVQNIYMKHFTHSSLYPIQGGGILTSHIQQ
jgi:hypothetical protein